MTIDFSKHKQILLQILKDIYTNTSLATGLGFKGGTAAYLFYGLDRYSVDLDFDLLDDSREKEVFEELKKIVSKYATIEDEHIKRFNLVIVAGYEVGAQKIKIEVNRRQFGSKYDLQTLLGISMQVMTKEDMFAHKLMAMLERIGKTSRDIYDVYFFFKNRWSINKLIVEQRSGVTYKEALQRCIDLLEKMDGKHVLDGLGELLTSQQKDWARAKLKEETIFYLKMAMES